MSRRALLTLIPALMMTACARLDYVQIGSLDQTQGTLTPIHVELSETGFDAAATAEIARQVAMNAGKDQAAQAFEDVRNILALVNMGPRTGNPVYTDAYAEKLMDYLIVQCPSGELTGVSSIREAKGFGPVTGEIVGVRAYCVN